MADIVRLLLTTLAVLAVCDWSPCCEAGKETKESFLETFRFHVHNVGKTRCDSSNEEALWNEYCDQVEQVARPCPFERRLLEESNDCALPYVFERVEAWPDTTFASAGAIRTALDELFASLPREQCGYNSSYHCPREESLCHREPSTLGTCWPADEVCADRFRRDLCIRSGKLYLLKTELNRFLENDDLDSQQQSARGAPPAPTASESTVQSVEFKVGVAVAAGLFLALGVAVMVVKHFREWRRSQERAAADAKPLIVETRIVA